MFVYIVLMAAVFSGVLAAPLAPTVSLYEIVAPQTVAMDGSTLARTRALWANLETRPQVETAVNQIIQNAKKYLAKAETTNWTVTSKDTLIASELVGHAVSSNDYMSVGPYWWPSNTAPCRASSTASSTRNARQEASQRAQVQTQQYEYLASVSNVISKYPLTDFQKTQLTTDLNQFVKTANLNIMGTTVNGNENIDIITNNANGDSAQQQANSSSSVANVTFVRCDGIKNTELTKEIPDMRQWQEMTEALYYMSLAYWYTGDESFAYATSHAISRWFLNPTEAMNPNLNYAQLVPNNGNSTGRPEGIIEFINFVEQVLDPIALLRARGSAYWTLDANTRMMAWSAQFQQWLTASPLGQADSQKYNNHAVWYTSLVTGIAMHVGDSRTATAYINKARQTYIIQQQAPNGMLPFEVTRTRSMHYTLYGLEAFLRVAIYGHAAFRNGDSAFTQVQHSSDSLLVDIKKSLDWFQQSYTSWPFYDIDASISNAANVRQVYLLASGAFSTDLQTKQQYLGVYSSASADNSTVFKPYQVIYAGEY